MPVSSQAMPAAQHLDPSCAALADRARLTSVISSSPRAEGLRPRAMSTTSLS